MRGIDDDNEQAGREKDRKAALDFGHFRTVSAGASFFLKFEIDDDLQKNNQKWIVSHRILTPDKF